MLRHSLENIRQNKGFTLPEVILVVAVMSILSAMAFPDIVSFFKRQRAEQENLALMEIRKAMDAYAKENLLLPARSGNPNGDWADELAQFTNLTAEEIRRDSWNRPRTYTQGVIEPRTYREATLDIYYATLASAGPLPNSSNEPLFDTPNVADWNTISQYAQIEPQADDMLVKYTDLKVKTERFDVTLLRMDRVIESLDRYAQAKFNEAVIAGEPCVSEKIFYPYSSFDNVAHNNPNARAGCTNVGAGSNKYGSNVMGDMSAFGAPVAGGIGTSRLELEGLMRLLGLPEDHCCDALTGAPFVYYSNPRPQSAGGACFGSRRTAPPYLPPRLAIDPPVSCD